MKKLTVFILAVVLLTVMLAIPVFAASGSAGATVSASACKPGDTVEVTFALQGYDEVNALSVTYNAPAGLQQQSAQWLLPGTIMDVNMGKNQAVWTNSNMVSLSGYTNVFKVTFLVLESAAGQGNSSFNVSFSAKVTRNSEVLGTPSAGASFAVAVPATGINLSSSALTMDMKGNSSAVLTATVTPANATEAVVWSSSNPAVVSVNNGTVTAHGRGNAIITAKAGSVSASCNVAVNCSHELTEVKAQTPTCQKAGNKQHYTCSLCAIVLASDKKTETTVQDQMLAPVSHSGGTATCTQQAVCTMCKQPHGAPLGHNMQHHAAQKATCVKGGTLEYWTCSRSGCVGKKYGDAKGQSVLTSVVEDVNPDNHTGGMDLKNVVAATCSEEGYSGDAYCKSCKQLAKKGEVVPATGKHTPEKGYLTNDTQHWQICSKCDAEVERVNHTFNWVVDQKPTETVEGIEHEECTACGVKRSEDTVVEKLKHTPVLVSGKEPTCTENGVLEHFRCVNCGNYYASDAGHAGDRISQSSITLAATGHSFDEEWLSDKENHWHACVCGETSAPEAHEPEIVGAVKATETQEGYTGDTICGVCGYEIATGEAVSVQEPESTEDVSVTAPVEETEPLKEEISDPGIDMMLWIIPVLIAAAVAIILLIAKKRRK